MLNLRSEFHDHFLHIMENIQKAAGFRLRTRLFNRLRFRQSLYIQTRGQKMFRKPDPALKIFDPTVREKIRLKQN